MSPGDLQDPAQPLLDMRQTRELLGYAAASLYRHRRQILIITLVATALSVPALLYTPRTFTTTARVTARREVVMAALAHPRRSMPFYADNPAHHAPEMTLRDDHLRELIRRIDLARTFRERRPPVLQFKDWLVDAVMGPPTDAELEKALMGAIERNVQASSNNEIVTITGTWRDPVTAAELVDTLKQLFMEERRRLEVEPILEAVKLLDEEVRKAGVAVDMAFAELRILHAADRAENRRQARRLRAEVEAERLALFRQEQAAREAHRVQYEQYTNLQSQLIAKRRSIAELEGERTRQTQELRKQLVSLEARLGERHPQRQAVQRDLETLQAGIPEVAVLKREEEELAEAFARMGGHETGSDRTNARPIPPPPPPMLTAALSVQDPAAGALLGRASEDEDEAVVHKRTELRMLVDRSQDLQERLLGARIEQRVAEDAFRFRYYVLQEPDPPRRPDRLQPYVMLLGGFFSGLLLGIFSALARDILSGRIFQAWQVDRFLGLRLVGNVDLPPLA
ncbi:MAG: hypothetical protein HY904_03085 [Deltaproteobacteria bacterium]|nr:hypothetical protein [Deltaproteobacteria bacterium]